MRENVGFGQKNGLAKSSLSISGTSSLVLLNIDILGHEEGF